MSTPDRILLAHGSGGRLTQQLVHDVFLSRFDNPYLRTLTDAAILDAMPAGRPAMSTDGFVVDPPIFPGGDLGCLSVCGTVNDLAVAGAKPVALTWGLILEEGVDGAFVETIVDGAARAAKEAGVSIVAGDTKVVPRGKADKAFVVTAGLGVVPPSRDLGDHRVISTDAIVASGALGDHGACVMAWRHDMASPTLQSDCAPLTGMIESVLEAGVNLHAMHDPTRGGLTTVCHEVASRAEVRILLDEDRIPVRDEVRGVCDLLGLDPLYLACEGRALFFLPPDDVPALLACLRNHPYGRGAVAIGHCASQDSGHAPVAMATRIGGVRPLDLLSGSDLPRIC